MLITREISSLQRWR